MPFNIQYNKFTCALSQCAEICVCVWCIVSTALHACKSRSSFLLLLSECICWNRGRTSFCNLCANAKEQNPKIEWCKRALRTVVAKRGMLTPLSLHAYISLSLTLSLQLHLHPLFRCVFISNRYFGYWMRKHRSNKDVDLIYATSINVRVNGHTHSSSSISNMSKMSIPKVFGTPSLTHTSIHAHDLNSNISKLRSNVCQHWRRRRRCGRQLGKTVRKLENELAYLMEYHVLNGLCASVLGPIS